MVTKIVRTGNSRAVIIPAVLADELGWKVGTALELQPMATGVAVTDPETARSIVSVGERIMKEHAEVFRELASK